ncbi:hypothetical protein SAMN04488498_11586 [Mesorhizobium albiziae]|uniref:Uncharacterized protein n=1 Tax=Neomesorhizobium albiziae TaxID=335020 RepID=A0A1I4D1X9_9HYPH|nr:hypothetical protein SAMN04488498_11586 [Mesorhizobium albiziae]
MSAVAASVRAAIAPNQNNISSMFDKCLAVTSPMPLVPPEKCCLWS